MIYWLLYVIPYVSLFSTAIASPRETSKASWSSVTLTATPAPPTVTEAAIVRCQDGSTILHTKDCTAGTPVSYCHKQMPPITCGPGFFPSVWHPGHCLEEETCFALDADWITTECSNGAYPFTTTTLYEGRLAGGEWTAVSGKNIPITSGTNCLSLWPISPWKDHTDLLASPQWFLVHAPRINGIA